MPVLRSVYQLLRADYLERIRRYSFLVTLALTIFAVYMFLPPVTANYRTFAFSDLEADNTYHVSNAIWYRGIYNSPWVGMQVSVVASLLLCIIGFYLVKNAVTRDLNTGVGQIIATTPLNRVQYTVGKMLSNFMVLATMVGVIVITAGATQLLRGEDMHLDLWALLAPFVFILLPTMAVVAAVAVLFETIAWLRGGLGNVIYFFLWIFGLVASVSGGVGDWAITDMTGIVSLVPQVQSAVKVAFPAFIGDFSMGLSLVGRPPQMFYWAGPHWTWQILSGRLLWIGMALAIAALAALFFSRFDPAKEWSWRAAKAAPQAAPTEEKTPALVVPALSQVHLTPLPAKSQRLRPAVVLMGELRLLLKGVSWWWYMVALGLIATMLFVPFDAVRAYLYPMVWIWPLLLWSAMGNREMRYQTDQLVYSTAHPLLSQLPMQWLTGVLLAFATASGMAVRYVLVGNSAGIMALVVGAIFVPTLALTLGIWTRNSRLFEVLYLFLWYAGAINHLPILDYMGTTQAAVAVQMPVVLLIGTVVLLMLAFVGRQQQLRV